MTARGSCIPSRHRCKEPIQGVSPINDKHRVLVIGVGSIGERHTRCFLATQRAEVAVCDPLPDRCGDVAKRYELPHAFGSIEEALNRWPAEIAVIASPAHTHLEIAVRLVEAGLDVLIEKPLSVSLEGVDKLTSAVQRHKRVAGVAYCWRYHPLVEQAHRFLASSPLGRLLEIVCQAGQCFPYYRPAYRDIYYKDRATGGGAVQDAVTHLLNGGEWFAGPIRQLAADAAHQHLAGVTVEDTVHVITRQGLDGAVMGSYSLNQYQPANEVNWSIVCEGGLVRIEVGNSRWMWQDDPAADWNVISLPPPERDAMYIAQAAGFLDAVEGCGESRCSLGEGIQTLKVNLAVLRDIDGGRNLAPIE